jgi:hypothetical protein
VIEICPSESDLIPEGAVKPGLPKVVQQLVRWREKNHLSQRAAVQVMMDRGLDVSLFTLQTWEQGYRNPGRYAAQALSAFLRENPVIPNPPQYRRGPKPGKRRSPHR